MTMADPHILAILRDTTLFARFNDEQLEVVPKVGRTRRYQPGETIVDRGEEHAQSMWVVLEGEVDVCVGGEVIGTLGPGKHFGELALLADAARSADVVAAGPVTALEFSRSHLRGLIHGDPEVGLAILAELATRLRELTDLVAAMMEASPEADAVARAMGIARRSDPAGEQLDLIEASLERSG
jgi:CRP-like cAMP-binding protein